MSKSSKTTTSQQTHNVTTPTNPDWVTNSVQGLSGDIGKLSSMDPYSLVSGPNVLQQRAANSAADLTGSPWNYEGGMNIARNVAGQEAPTVQAASLLDGLSNYMSPYTNDVVNTTLAGYDKNAGMTRAQQSLDMARSGAFGGSGAAITQSMTEGDLAQRRAATEAGLRDQAFNTGAGLSNLDAGRRQDASGANAQLSLAQRAQQLQAAGLLGDLSGAMDANQRANIGTQAGMGADMRAIEQQRLSAPINLLQARTALTGSLPYNLFNGQVQDGTMNGTQTTKSSDPLGTLGSLAMLAAAPFTGGASLLGGLGGLGAGLGASLAGGIGAAGTSAAGLAGFGSILSDERAKTDIKTVGYDDKGRRWVSYRYKGHSTVHRGVIAQEVMRTDPKAVSLRPDGWLQVDYGMLEAA